MRADRSEREIKDTGLFSFQKTYLISLFFSTIFLSTPVLADTITWDAGAPGGSGITNADGDWNDDASNDVWSDGTATAVAYSNGDDVRFEDGAGPANVTVTLTEDVSPSSIRFLGVIANFTIAGPGNQILSNQGDFGGTNSGTLEIFMGNSATINAGLNGDFVVLGSDQLTLGGASANLSSLLISSISTVEISASGNLAGVVTNRGDLNVLGNANDVVNNSSGMVSIAGGGDVNGTLTNSGTVTISGAGSSAATVVNNSSANVSVTAGGSITGTLTNSGLATLEGNVGSIVNSSSGDVNVDASMAVGATIQNAGDITVASGSTATVTGLTTNQNGGDIFVQSNGNFAGSILNQNGGDVFVSPNGTITGNVENQGGADLFFLGSTNLTGNLVNQGNTQIANGGAVGGLVDNSGVVSVNGTVNFNGGLTNSGTIDLQDGGADDTLVISGPITGNAGGVILLDTDLSGTGTTTDLVSAASSVVSGNVVLSFNNVAGTYGALTTGVTVMTYDPNSSATFSAVGLGAIGGLVYLLDTATAGEVQIITSQNPGLGGLAGAVTLTQSLIGSVINRPSSPFVTGLALTGDDPCAPGAWGRVIGGKADARGTTSSVTSNGGALSYDSEISATYSGFQVGGDFSCFDGYFRGWDMSFGGIAGINLGSTSQPILAINAGTGSVLPGLVVSNNKTDFTQTYAGVYLSAARERFLVDLQYRLESTSFDLENDGVGQERIGILNQTFKSAAQTLSGSFSYAIPVNKERRITFVPSAGFAYTRTSTDTIGFENDGRLEIQDATTEVGFVGGSLAMTNVRPSGRAAVTYFGTATYYKDFADPVRSVFYENPTAAGVESFSSNLGQFGEVSLGLNYTRILESGKSIANARQLNASIRLDARTGDTLDSWGVTGQFRLQF